MTDHTETVIAGDQVITYDVDDDGRCCALDAGHGGVCAYICNTCNGTTHCPFCGGPSGDDTGNGCGECDGTGHCFHCYEGMTSDA